MKETLTYPVKIGEQTMTIHHLHTINDKTQAAIEENQSITKEEEQNSKVYRKQVEINSLLAKADKLEAEVYEHRTYSLLVEARSAVDSFHKELEGICKQAEDIGKEANKQKEEADRLKEQAHTLIEKANELYKTASELQKNAETDFAHADEILDSIEVLKKKEKVNGVYKREKEASKIFNSFTAKIRKDVRIKRNKAEKLQQRLNRNG